MGKRLLPQDEGDPALRRAAKSLLRRGGSKTLQSLTARSLAVCSGKGGVGKTITASNLAILFARRGLRVGLVDLDPLSDVATLLDVADSESALDSAQDLSSGSLADYRVAVFSNLDLIFPHPKLGRAVRSALLEKLFRELAEALQQAYDLLVFDLPAGSDFDENLVFLPFMKLLVLVTNPEPTAHAAAGAYIRRALTRYPGVPIQLWHNRYGTNSREGFDPRDVVGNYNRNVPPEERLDPHETRQLGDLAFVPEDPALNLLQGNPGADENIHRFLADTLKFADEQRLRVLAQGLPLPPLAVDILVLYLNAHGPVEEANETLDGFGRYLQILASRAGADGDGGREVFSREERQALTRYLLEVQRDPLRKRLLALVDVLDERLQGMQASRGPFAPGIRVQKDRAVDRELSSLLIDFSRAAAASPALVRQGGLLLFYFSLYKLLQSATVTELIARLVPVRQNPRGARVRDRNRQIRSLIEGDPEHRELYLKTLRTLYPVVVRQLTNMVKVLGLSPLLFRGSDGKVLRTAYLKLLTSFLHDTLYGGLSVVVGFPYRACGRAFEEGADRVLEMMGIPAPQARAPEAGSPQPGSPQPGSPSRKP